MNPYRTFTKPNYPQSRPRRVLHTFRRKLIVWWYGKFVDRCVKCPEHMIHNCKCQTAINLEEQQVRALDSSPGMLYEHMIGYDAAAFIDREGDP